MFLKRRLVAAPLPPTQGALKQPNGGTRAPVTNGLVLTGGLEISILLQDKNHAPKPSFFVEQITGIAKGGVRNRTKGGCQRLLAFVRVCSRLLAFACVFASAFSPPRLLAIVTFVRVCLRLLAFAYAPLCYAPLCVTLTKNKTVGSETKATQRTNRGYS